VELITGKKICDRRVREDPLLKVVLILEMLSKREQNLCLNHNDAAVMLELLRSEKTSEQLSERHLKDQLDPGWEVVDK